MDRSSSSAPATGLARLVAYYELTKPGIAAYIMITAAVSTWVMRKGSAAT